MQFRLPAWSVPSYAHDRRKHRHRCRVCGRILETGDAAFMAKIRHNKTWTVHEACADVQHGTAAWTWRDAMKWWAFEYQVKCYGRSFTNRRDDAHIEKYMTECGLVRPPS